MNSCLMPVISDMNLNAANDDIDLLALAWDAKVRKMGHFIHYWGLSLGWDPTPPQKKSNS